MSRVVTYAEGRLHIGPSAAPVNQISFEKIDVTLNMEFWHLLARSFKFEVLLRTKGYATIRGDINLTYIHLNSGI